MNHASRRRSSPRAEIYDYRTPGTYAVTVCVAECACLLGQATDERIELSEAGWATQKCWFDLPRCYPRVLLDAFVVMPNHVHGILILQDVFANDAGETFILDWERERRVSGDCVENGLSEIVRGFKSSSTRRINAIRGTPGATVWQRSFYDSIIRNGPQLERVRQYIHANPGRWIEDEENPDRRR